MTKYLLFLTLITSACTYSTTYYETQSECVDFSHNNKTDIKSVDLGTDMVDTNILTGCPNETVTANSLVGPGRVYTTNCAFSGCHAGGGTVFNANTAADLSALVDRASTQTNKMPLVTAGKPEQSYLIYKLNGLQVFVDGSGNTMPFGIYGILPKTDRCKFITWIKQGAN